MWIVYFDSGTTNTRAYLLNGELKLLAEKKMRLGSRDSAIAGGNRVLIDGLYDLFSGLLAENNGRKEDVSEIYASGMVTSSFGLCEVPHLVLPVTEEQIANALYPFFEAQKFKRDIRLIPGLKTSGNKIEQINNVRGEEIELIGIIPEIRKLYGNKSVAVVMPGSHTHIFLIKGSQIEDISSNFTGELYQALREETILAPVLNHRTFRYDPEMVKQGVRALHLYGFNRALYLCHARNIFHEGTPEARRSYAEGVILGGICRSLETMGKRNRADCETAVIVAPPEICALYEIILSTCVPIREISSISVTGDGSPALRGLRRILDMKGL